MTATITTADVKKVAVKTRPATKPRVKKVAASTGLAVEPEPDFSALVGELSRAESLSKATRADATAATHEKQRVAVSTIKAAYAEKLPPEDVRRALLDGGVLKGTVSKIVTILVALHAKTITLADVRSLNAGYEATKSVAAGLAAATTAAPVAPSPAPAKLHTPDDALAVIVAHIRAQKDADAQFKEAGVWLSKVTTTISELVKELDDSDD
jgi:hypothetical protein